MKTIINGMEFEGTPKELKEFLDLNQASIREEGKPISPKHTVVAATGPKSLISTPRKLGKRGGGRAGSPIYTISMINGQRIKYANQTLCAKFLQANPADVSRRKDTGRPINGYYITTKEA